MEKELIETLKKLFRKVLANNIEYSISSDLVFSCARLLLYLENINNLKPKGSFYIKANYKENDGHNENGHTYHLTIKNGNAALSSNHYFKEAFGQHFESHEEILYPDESFSFKELEDNYKSWEEGFIKGLKNEVHFTDSLTAIKSTVQQQK